MQVVSGLWLTRVSRLASNLVWRLLIWDGLGHQRTLIDMRMCLATPFGLGLHVHLELQNWDLAGLVSRGMPRHEGWEEYRRSFMKLH